jgi:hypothetical protein
MGKYIFMGKTYESSAVNGSKSLTSRSRSNRRALYRICPSYGVPQTWEAPDQENKSNYNKKQNSKKAKLTKQQQQKWKRKGKEKNPQ